MEQLLKQVRRARWWLGVQRFLGVLGCWLSGTLSVAFVLVVVDKCRPLGVEAWIWAAAALGLGLVAAIGWAVATGRGLVAAAVELDRRCGLKERVSSSLSLSEEERASALGQALIEDARRHVERIDVREHFRAAPGRQLLLPVAPAIAVVLVALLVSPAAVGKPAAVPSNPAAKKQIQQSSDTLRRKLVEQRKEAQKLGLKEAEALFQRLERDMDQLQAKTEGDRKQALVKLNDLSRELQKRRERLGGTEAIQKQFNQLKDIGQGPAERLVDEIKRGDFQKAIEELKKLQENLAQGKLSAEEQKQLAEQMEQIEKKLKELADAQRQAQKDLENRIRQAHEAGQHDEAGKLQEQLDKLRQQMPQLDRLDQLADKLGQCAKCLNQGQLQDAAGALGELENELKDLQGQLNEMKLIDEAMDQMAQGRNQMNCGHCNGAGCQMCQGNQPGDGIGRGRGRGSPSEPLDDVKHYDTKVSGKTGQGAAMVVGEVDGPNLRGDVQHQFQTQLDNARHESADPLTDQHMPRKHRQHAREYFDRLREGE
jgi:hypothetical protein